MQNIKKNWVTPWDSPSHHLKCHLPLKTKEKVMECQWKVSRRSSLNYSRVGCVIQISSFLKTVLQQDSSVIKSHPFFSGTERETPLQMEISFISVNVPQKNNFYSVFSFSCVYFWKTQSTHNNLSAKEPYSGVTHYATLSVYSIFVFLKCS